MDLLFQTERARFDKIYKRFISAREDKDAEFDPKGKLRTALA